MIARGACDCSACMARAEREWDAFVEGHEEVADHLRRVWLNPNGTTPAQRINQFIEASRRAGDTEWDGA